MDSINIISTPDNERVGTHSVESRVETTEQTDGSGNVLDVQVEVQLRVNGSLVSTKNGSGTSGDTFNVTFDYNFSEEGNYNLITKALIDYGGEQGYDFGVGIETYKDSGSISIISGGADTIDLSPGLSSYVNAYQGRSTTTIEDITTQDDVNLLFDEIDFEPFGNPSVSLSSSARFAVHEILGGTTVRQKIGEDPREITVSGVATEPVAREINQLHQAELVSLNSATIDDFVRCQVASASTDPLEDGGAVDMDGGEFLYDFSISLVEVEVL